ncbi:hypothetical protein D6777_01830 [Candidatus Woesearchaeota archaeon]|nr:MAG: hypothetical protein D6777_01830 [Candidatus Woesearchaeota archaeon]
MEYCNLIKIIKQKKELNSLSDEFVLGIIKIYLKNEMPKLLENQEWLNNTKNKYFRTVVKNVRKNLREVHGAFKKKGYDKKYKLLDEIKSLNDFEGHAKILKLHTSTAERLKNYIEIYGKILEKVYKVESLLDLGAGLNPLSIPFMDFKVGTYYAVEVAEDDVEFINAYFKKFNIKGHAFVKDLTYVDNLPEVDVCFMFKLLDTLESLKKDVTKELISKVKAKWLVVSFATKSLGGRKVISKKRTSWFKKIIKAYEYDTFEVDNEYFFVVRKDL